jgi:hypothetical protein
MNINRWHWDYEEGANPSYYHIYDDDGTIITFDIPRDENADNVVYAICSFVNGLNVVEGADKVIKESRKIRSK